MFLNQVRTLVAHLWENDGEPMSVTAQFLDSVNVPPPATCRRCGRRWACATTRCTICCRACPIMLSARRIAGCAGSWTNGSVYQQSSHRGLSPLVVRLASRTLTNRRISA